MRVLPINSNSWSDSDLLEKYRKTGDKHYVGILYERYLHLVYGLCLKYLGTKEESQDAVMDIFERISGILLHDEIEFFKSWLYAVSKNHCLVHLRRHKEMLSIDENFMELDYYEHPNNKAALENDLINLEKCIEQLKEDQKKCIQLFFLQKKSYALISNLTKLTLKEVKSYIQNGKRNLKICMESHHVEA